MTAPMVRAVAAAIILIPNVALAQIAGGATTLAIQNASFEWTSAGKPLDWYSGGKGYRVLVDSSSRIDGQVSLRSERIDTVGSDGFGVATQSMPATPARGRSVRLSGWIRTEDVSSGYAGLWLRIDSAQRTLAFDNMQDRGPSGTTPWTRWVIELPVDSVATKMTFGVLHPGTGRAWFDSLRLEIISAGDTSTVAKQIPNGSFEHASGTSPAVWYSGGRGYQFDLDSTQHVDGRASLRSRWIDSVAWDSSARKFAVASQSLHHRPALGRKVRLSGWIRTERVDSGWAGLWIRVDGTGRVLDFDNMQKTGPRGTTPWTRYSIEVDVDSGASGVVFGVLHPGTGTAWFDSLGVEIVGPRMPRRVATFRPPPIPVEDGSRLLSDAELALPPEDSTPVVDAETAAWVRSHAQPIRSLHARDFKDLSFLRPLLAGKRLVQLGESGHGVREFNLAKVRLIQYLHEELGYDVLAFESSLFGCEQAGRAAAASTAGQLMRGCIFGVWHTEEVLPLFEYVRSTQSTSRPLVLTGFDVQQSGAADSARATFLSTVVGRLDTAYASRVRDMDGVLRRTVSASSGRGQQPAEGGAVQAFYDSLATWIGANERRLVAAFAEDSSAPALARQTAKSMSWYVQELVTRDNRVRTEARDRGMADNIDFLLNERYPGGKIIVWAHNFHIQHRGFGSVKRAGADTIVRTMGTWVAERHRNELYTIGLFMYRGSAAFNNRTIYPVRSAPNGSLEAILHRAPWKYAFVDLSRPGREPGTAWMTRALQAKAWGTTPETMVPRDEYDGLLFIDTTWPPAYSTGGR